MQMNKLIVTTMTTVLLMISGLAMAQDDFYGDRERNQRHKRGMQPMPVVAQVMRAVRHLDLSDEQKSAVKEIMHGLKQETRPIMSEMKANHMLLRDLIKAESYDEAAVADIAEAEGKLAAERLLVTSRALSDIYAQLTAEQRAELEAMAAERRERMSERRQKRKGGSENEPAADSCG
jgi:protein CpxP